MASQETSDVLSWGRQFEKETQRYLHNLPDIKASLSHLTAATERMAIAFERLDERDRDSVPLRTHYITVSLIASPSIVFCFASLVLILYFTNRDLTVNAAGLELKTIVQEEHEKTQKVIGQNRQELEHRISDVLQKETGIKEPIEVEIVGTPDGGRRKNPEPTRDPGVQDAGR